MCVALQCSENILICFQIDLLVSEMLDLLYLKLDLLLLKRGLKTFKSFKQDFFSLQMPYTLKYLKLNFLHLMRRHLNHSNKISFTQMPYTLKSFK